MHLCGHSSVKFLWSCDARAQDSFPLFYSTQCFQNMFFYPFVHSSESILGVRRNFTAFTLRVYTHFFSKTSYDRRIFLSIKSRKSSLSKTCWFFIFYFPSFSPYLLSLSSLFYYFYHDFVCFIFLDDVPKRKTLHGSRIPNIIDSNDINTNATIQTKMYALYK